MKVKFCLVLLSLNHAVLHLEAQQSPTLEELRNEMIQMRQSFQKQQEDYLRRIETLEQRIQSLSVSNAPQNEIAKPLDSQREANLTNSAPWELIRSGNNYLNLSLSGLFSAGSSTASDIANLQPGGHDPNQRGFTIQSVEATFQGMVDPYFRGLATMAYQLDAGGESTLELEEAYLESISLPANLTLKAGQFFTEFGRHNTLHAHTWAFADMPLVNARLLGPDGLRNPGARISWLTPTPFYSELFFTVQNSHGETAPSFRFDHESEPYLGRLHGNRGVTSLGDLLYAARYAMSFDLTDNQTLLLGSSAAFGPNATSTEATTEIYGLDVFWKWKSPTAHKGFPFVSWQSEAMLRRFRADAFNWDLNQDTILDSDEQDLDGDGVPDFYPAERLIDYGFYSQLAYGFKPGWVAAFRGEYVTSDSSQYESLFGRDPQRASRWRLSPNLTWYPTEFSKVRLQYNFDDRVGFGQDHSIWLQLEFLLGAHAAHKF